MGKKNFSFSWSFWLGPLLFCLIILSFASSFGLDQSVVLGTVIWMAFWWITRPVHIAITSLLPIVVNELFNLVPMPDVIGEYFSEIIVLLLGADILCLSWTVTGLDKRMALKVLCLLGNSLKQQIAVWLIFSALLSVFLPNVVVVTLMVPVAAAMLRYVGEESISTSKIAIPILLAIAWGAGIGGVGSPLGGAANLVSVSYIEKLSGQEFMYVDWFVRFLPFLFLLCLVNLFFLLYKPLPVKHLAGSREYFDGLRKELGPMKRMEKVSFCLFFAATVLAFARPLFADILPGMKPAFIFITFGLLCFFLKNDDGKPLLTWEMAEKNVMWGLLILFGGGLALGTLVTETGTATKLAEVITKMPLTGGVGTILVFTVFSIILTEVSSNTAAAAISIPIIQGITQGLGFDPIPYLLIATVGVNTAYMLPVSIRAIPVAHGLDPSVLFKKGLVVSLASIAVITLLGYAFICLWPGFGQL